MSEAIVEVGMAGRPLRIAMVRISRTIRGAETYTLALATNLAQRGHELLIVTRRRSPLIGMAEGLGLRAIGLAVSGDANVHAPGRFARAFRDESVDIVHAHGSHGVLACCMGAHRAGVPVVVTFHTPVVGAIREPRVFSLPSFVRRMGRPSLLLADHIIAVAECSRRYLLAQGFDPSRVSTIPNGIELERYSSGDRARLRAELGVADHEVLFGFLGALIEDKQPLRVISAFSELTHNLPVRLVMAGDGSLRTICEARIAELGLSGRVHVLGFRSDVADILAGIDCLVAPSLREGMPMTFLEAMAAGRPIIATDVGGVRELVVDGVCGRLLRVGDDASLVSAMRDFAMNAPLRHSASEAARRQVAARFSIALNADRVEAAVRSLLPP